MVGYIKGKVISKNPENGQCIVLTDGVGYELIVPPKTLESMELENETSLWVHTHVREDALLLYGFSTEAEKNLFRVLVGVSGLGPKTGLSLLNSHGPQNLCQYIVHKNAAALAEAPGVGKKLAQRLVLELGSKIEKLQWLSHLTQAAAKTAAAPMSEARQLRDDLSSALLHLGYQPQQIKSVVDKLFVREDNESKGFEILLKETLKELSARHV